MFLGIHSSFCFNICNLSCRVVLFLSVICNLLYSNCILYQDVEAFQKFLKSNGGHYGGWKEKDHLYFVKARSKYPPNKIAEIVNENFPGMLPNFTWIYTNLRLYC